MFRYCIAVKEGTLIFHLWLKNDQFLRSDFEMSGDTIDSRAMNCMHTYLELSKSNIIYKRDNLKIPKFHQMLHIFDNITRHGYLMNYDGSRGEFWKTEDKERHEARKKSKRCTHLWYYLSHF